MNLSVIFIERIGSDYANSTHKSQALILLFQRSGRAFRESMEKSVNCIQYVILIMYPAHYLPKQRAAPYALRIPEKVLSEISETEAFPRVIDFHFHMPSYNFLPLGWRGWQCTFLLLKMSYDFVE